MRGKVCETGCGQAATGAQGREGMHWEEVCPDEEASGGEEQERVRAEGDDTMSGPEVAGEPEEARARPRRAYQGRVINTCLPTFPTGRGVRGVSPDAAGARSTDEPGNTMKQRLVLLQWTTST